MTLAKLAKAVNCQYLQATVRMQEGKSWNLICKRDGRQTDQAHCGLCKNRRKVWD
nr:MAG TPA: hypothetical protein [Caudoviricetes sp.]